MAWQIDASHSSIQFSVRHMMISTVRGRFEEFSGQVHFDEQHPEKSSVSVEIKADSLYTKDENRDGHLRSPDFLNADEYPVITFNSTRVEKVNASHGRIYGDLTIRDVTREVVLDTEFVGKARSPWGATAAGFSASTSIDRKDWGLVWNVALETGGVLVGDKIKIDIELELIEQPEVVAEAVA
ncbi:MAG: YceI family protein [Caldilineaceae bacterium]|nr:YceI family protein [Caldilineaceae bacterium]